MDGERPLTPPPHPPCGRYIYRHRRLVAHRARVALAARLASAASPPRAPRRGGVPPSTRADRGEAPAGGAAGGGDDGVASEEDSDVGPLPLRMQRIEEGGTVEDGGEGLPGGACCTVYSAVCDSWLGIIHVDGY